MFLWQVASPAQLVVFSGIEVLKVGGALVSHARPCVGEGEHQII